MEIGDGVDIAAVHKRGALYYIMLLVLVLSGYKRAYYYVMNFHKNDMEVLLGYGNSQYNGYLYVQKKRTNPDGTYTVIDNFIIDWIGHVYNKDIIPGNACRVYRVNGLKEVLKLFRRYKTFDKFDAGCENKHNEYILDTL